MLTSCNLIGEVFHVYVRAHAHTVLRHWSMTCFISRVRAHTILRHWSMTCYFPYSILRRLLYSRRDFVFEMRIGPCMHHCIIRTLFAQDHTDSNRLARIPDCSHNPWSKKENVPFYRITPKLYNHIWELPCWFGNFSDTTVRRVVSSSRAWQVIPMWYDFACGEFRVRCINRVHERLMLISVPSNAWNQFQCLQDSTVKNVDNLRKQL